MLYDRAKADPVLLAVLSEIHKTAQAPPSGYLTRKQWAAKWSMKSQTMTCIYIEKAVAIGILIERPFRIVTNGRLMLVAHFGPPPTAKPKRKAA